MPQLHPCPRCAELVVVGVCSCPHCGAHHPCASRALPAAALALGLIAATGCVSGKDLQSDYTAAVTETAEDVDEDADGWTVAEGDCDDTDASVNPEATETPGDGIDSNCDGEDDT